MSIARVLLLSNNAATLYLWQGGHLHALEEFSGDDAGRAALATHLARDPRSVVDVLVDVIEEEFRIERIPHVQVRDRNALLRRRAEQAYRLTPYRSAEVLNQRIDGKREDEILLSALTNPDMIKPWIDVLLKQKEPLRGIFSVAHICGALLKPLQVKDKRALIITRQKSAGMRQTFFHERKLKISRLSPSGNSDADAYAAQLLTEVDKTQRYLARLKLMDRDDVLAVHCVSDGGDLDALRNRCRDTEKIKFHFHALGSLGLSPDGPNSTSPYSDALFMALLHAHLPQRNYASMQERRYAIYRHVRRGLHGASMATAIAAMSWSGMNVIDARLMQEFNATANRLQSEMQLRYEAVMAGVPETPVSAQSLQVGVEIAKALAGQRTLPRPMLSAVSSAVGAVPQVRVDSIDWRATQNPASIVFDHVVATAGPPEPQNAGAAAEPPPDELYQVAQIRGSLEPFDGDYRKAFESVNRFMDALRKTADVVRVEPVEMPLNVNPAASMQGNAGLRERDQTAAFIVNAVLKVTHETR